MTCNFSLAKSVRALSFFSPRNLLSYVTFTHPMQVQFQLYLQDAEKQYTFSHRFSTTLHNSYKKLFFPSIFKGFSPKTTIFLGFSKNKICAGRTGNLLVFFLNHSPPLGRQNCLLWKLPPCLPPRRSHWRWPDSPGRWHRWPGRCLHPPASGRW